MHIIGGPLDKKDSQTVGTQNSKFAMFDGLVKVWSYEIPCCEREQHMNYYLETKNCVSGQIQSTRIDGEYLVIENVNRCLITGDTYLGGGCTRMFSEGD